MTADYEIRSMGGGILHSNEQNKRNKEGKGCSGGAEGGGGRAERGQGDVYMKHLLTFQPRMKCHTGI